MHNIIVKKLAERSRVTEANVKRLARLARCGGVRFLVGLRSLICSKVIIFVSFRTVNVAQLIQQIYPRK